ncbi:MAG: ABC transporter permease [Clostridiales bacterium]|nr:ABC transporter permease [Clostridiales bacterium]
MGLSNLIKLDIKRLFSSKGVVLLCVLSPLLVLLIFFSVVYPSFIITGTEMTPFGIVNDEDSEAVQRYVDAICGSEALINVATPYPVESLEIGRQMVDDNKIAILVHIPEDFFVKMKACEDVDINMIGSKSHSFDVDMVGVALETSLSTVGKSQNILEYVRKDAIEKGIPEYKANEFVLDFTYFSLTQQMNRRAVIGMEGPLSKTGEFFPFEYYIGVVFALFAMLGMLPIIQITAKDKSGALIKRGLFIGHSPMNFYISRLISGVLMITLILFMLLPTKLLVGELGYVFGVASSANIFIILLGAFTIALCIASMAIMIGSIFSNVEASLWMGFYVIMIVVAFSGIFFNNLENLAVLKSIGEYMPLRLSIGIITNILFDFSTEQYLYDIGKIVILTVVFVIIGRHNYLKRSA